MDKPWVDSVGDLCNEMPGALGADVKSLIPGGGKGLKSTDNALANTITGNYGSNTLDGGTGADPLVGEADNGSR